MPTTRTRFVGSRGTTMAALLDAPDGEPHAVALFAHCFTCSKETSVAARVARGLTGRGFAVLRFDFAGLGESGGDFAESTFTADVADLVRAADHLRTTLAAPKLLVGHSLGGAAVVAAAPSLPEVRGVVTLGAPASPDHVQHLFSGAVEEIRRTGEARVTIGGRPFTVGEAFVHDIEAQPQRERLASLRRPLLVLHSPQDATVGIDNARQIFEAARHPKSFVALDGADHLLTRRRDAAYVADLVATWAGRYVLDDDRADDDRER